MTNVITTPLASAPEWEAVGTKAETTDMQEALRDAGINFDVEKQPAMQQVENINEALVSDILDRGNFDLSTVEGTRDFAAAVASRTFKKVGDWSAIRRCDDKETTFGVAGKVWQPLQHSEAADWFQPAVDEGLVRLDTVGTLGGGKKMWVLAELNSKPVEIIPGESIAKYMIMTNGHDGKTAVRVGFTPIRVWCANQFPQLRKDAGSRLIRIKHSQHTKMRLDDIRSMINFANAEFEATAEQYRKLLNCDINQQDVLKYVKLCLDVNPTENHRDDSFSTRKRNIIDHVVDLVHNGRGNKRRDVQGTLYAAFNGYNEYLNYEVGNNAANRFDSLLGGQNATKNTRALDLAVSIADGRVKLTDGVVGPTPSVN